MPWYVNSENTEDEDAEEIEEEEDEGEDEDEELDEECFLLEEEEESEEPESSEALDVEFASQYRDFEQSYPLDYHLSLLLKSRASIGLATVNPCSDAPNPKIYLEEYGWLREPPILQSETFEKALFDGSERIDFVELEAGRFTCRSEQWKSFVDREMLKVMREPCINDAYELGSVRLLLSSSTGGGIVPQHQTTDTDQFGTFVILLPSDSGTRSVTINGYGEVKSWSEDQSGSNSVLSCFWLDGMEASIGEGVIYLPP